MSDTFTEVSRAPITAVTVRPRMSTATRISISDSPRSSVTGAATSDLHLVVDAVHGRHQCDGDETHDQAHDDQDDRLEQRGDLVDLVGELAFVVLGGDF